jgi:pentatricopeptide repeat protein
MFIDSEKYDDAIIFYNQVSKRPEFKNLPEQIRGNMTIALWKILDGELNANKMNIAKKVCKLINSPYLPEDESTFFSFISTLEMIEGYLQNGRIDKAETIFLDLIKRGSDIFPILQIARIGTRLMDVLMEKDILNKTLDIYKALETLKSSPEIELEKAKAVYRTSIKFSTLGHMDKGLKFLNKIDDLVENEDIKSLKIKAIVRIICDYIKLGQIDSAIKLYKTIENVNSPIEDVYHTLEASLKLMKACLKENKNETAKEILTNVVKLSKIKDKKIEKTISEMKKIYAKSVHPDS